MKYCENCGKELNDGKCDCNKKAFYKEKWFMWVTLIFLTPVGIVMMFLFNKNLKIGMKILLTIVFGFFWLIAIGSSLDDSSKNSSDELIKTTIETEIKEKCKTVKMLDLNKLTENEAGNLCTKNKFFCHKNTEYSDTIPKGGFIRQDKEAGEEICEGDTVEVYYSLGKEPTIEQQNALIKAQRYSDNMHMSKKGIYDQLTSEYGEGFDKNSAQYAIDNVKANWNLNALSKAESYQQTMNMSKSAIYSQLISSYGEKFTKSEAQYAIDNLG